MLSPLQRQPPSFAALFIAALHVHAHAKPAFRSAIHAEGRITKITSGTQTTESFYDAEGRRISAQNRVFVYAPSGELAFALGGTSKAGTRYLTRDHLGRTRIVTRQDKSVAARFDYAPFAEDLGARTGGRTAAQGYATLSGLSVAGADPWQRFTGKQRDAETGLDYLGARYMSSAQGRFTSPDTPFADQHPADPQSWNLYAYGRNNPLLYTDPTGVSVEITNCQNADDCLQAIRAATGSSAAGQQIQVKTQVEQRGWLGRLLGLNPIEHKFIEITGDVQAFRATSENASRLADFVGNTQNVQFAITEVGSPKNISFDIFGGGNVVLKPGGATSRVPSDNFYPAVFVYPGAANYAGDPTSQALGIPAANRAERTAHELLGHVWAEVARGIPGAGKQANPANAAASVRAENNVRNTQPGRGIKTRH